MTLVIFVVKRTCIKKKLNVLNAYGLGGVLAK